MATRYANHPSTATATTIYSLQLSTPPRPTRKVSAASIHEERSGLRVNRRCAITAAQTASTSVQCPTVCVARIAIEVKADYPNTASSQISELTDPSEHGLLVDVSHEIRLQCNTLCPKAFPQKEPAAGGARHENETENGRG